MYYKIYFNGIISRDMYSMCYVQISTSKIFCSSFNDLAFVSGTNGYLADFVPSWYPVKVSLY